MPQQPRNLPLPQGLHPNLQPPRAAKNIINQNAAFAQNRLRPHAQRQFGGPQPAGRIVNQHHPIPANGNNKRPRKIAHSAHKNKNAAFAQDDKSKQVITGEEQKLKNDFVVEEKDNTKQESSVQVQKVKPETTFTSSVPKKTPPPHHKKPLHKPLHKKNIVPPPHRKEALKRPVFKKEIPPPPPKKVVKKEAPHFVAPQEQPKPAAAAPQVEVRDYKVQSRPKFIIKQAGKQFLLPDNEPNSCF